MNLSEEEQKEFNSILDWLTYDSEDHLEDIDSLVRKMQEKIYWRKEEPSKEDLEKLREAKRRVIECLASTSGEK
jgi:hypothetical protein